MALIKSKDTNPELTVRRLVHAMGYRYRLHKKELPGKPDLVFAGRRKVIYVHGCYWHCHLHYDPTCRRARPAKSNLDYWGPKLARNIARDKVNIERLQATGWDVLVLWECRLKDRDNLMELIFDFLGPPSLRGTDTALDNARKAIHNGNRVV